MNSLEYDYTRAHAQLDMAGVPTESEGEELSLAERVAWLRGRLEAAEKELEIWRPK